MEITSNCDGGHSRRRRDCLATPCQRTVEGLLDSQNADAPQARSSAHPCLTQDTLPALRLRDSAKRDSANRHRAYGMPKVQQHLHS
jgi:hypothetical protein